MATPPAGSLSARSTRPSGGTQYSSLSGSTGVAPTASPTAGRTATREAILAKPTATQQLGQAPTVISFQTVQGRTQTLVPITKVQPVITLSPLFAGKAAAAVEGGVIVERTPILRQQPSGIFRPVGAPVGIARFPYAPPPSVVQQQAAFVTQPVRAPPPVERPEIPAKMLRAATREEIKKRRGEQFAAPILSFISGVYRGGLLAQPVPEQIEEGALPETDAQKITRILGSGLGAVALQATGAEGVVARLTGGATRVARFLGISRKAVPAVKAVAREVVPVVERVAPAIPIAERVVPSVAKAPSRIVQVLQGVPQAAGEVAIGQVALSQAVKQIERSYGTDIVRGAQESSALVFAPREEEGLVTVKPARQVFTDFAKRFVGALPAGQQALRVVSPAFRAEEEKAIREVGASRGLSGVELDTFVENVIKAGNRLQAAEALTTLFTVERTTERLGAKEIARAFAKREGVQIPKKEAVRKLFALTAPRFAIAGAIEGAAQYITQLQTRGGEPTIKGGVISVAGGALISTILGGGAVAFAATRPTVSKVFTGIGQALEFPYEAGGDILAAGQKAMIRRLGGEVVEPAIKPVFRKGVKSASQEAAEKFELTVLGRKPSVGKPRVTVPSFGGEIAPTVQAPTAAQVQSNIQATSKDIATTLRGEVPVRAKAKVQIPPPRVPTPTPVTEPIKEVTPIKTPAEIKTEVKIETPITTPVEALANIGIPIQTNVFGLRGMLPPPLPFPIGEGGGLARGGRKLFANELLASQNLFRQQIRFGIKTLAQPVGKKPKVSKRKQPSKSEARSSLAKQLSFAFGRGRR